ncbi:MAG: cation diffusion facilitator family transporter [Prevotellaceae bacterium]|jgi:cobalt-zinc-cadmium efflux system protein|nr:cation diffusion facilitator family transporter [Prevotellaceae bacterium]
MDEHTHEHHHNAYTRTLNRAFVVGITLNLLFVGAEFGVGLWANSLALLSDAGHNLSDVVGLALAMFAFRLSRVKASDRYTYGYEKSTILVSLCNAVILLLAVGAIFIESIHKLWSPTDVAGTAIAWTAGIGVVVNGVTAMLFLRDRQRDLNVKGAYLHMLADAMVSIGVLVSGIVITHTGWYVIDPIIGIGVALIILISTWKLLRDSLRLSLDGVPAGINIEKIAQLIRNVPDVESVHHIHIWALSTTEVALTAHVVTRTLNDMEQTKHDIKETLESHGIGHATLEFELNSAPCGNESHCG